MKKLFLGILLTLFFTSVHAQDAQLAWANSMGGTSYESGKSITVDHSGNVYVTGYYQGTVDFDPGIAIFNLTSNGNRDIFIQKLDSSGNFIWAKSIGGTNLDYGRSIKTDDSSNVYITGSFRNTVDFDPSSSSYNLTSAGFDDIFIQKLDAWGNFIWAKSMGGSGYDRGSSISIDGLGNVYVTGDFEATADFDPSASTFNLTSNGGDDIFIQKLDAGGNFNWAKSMGGTSNDVSYSITIDGLGNSYITGSYRDTVDFDPGTSIYNLRSNGFDDIFIQKMDANGNFIWAKSMGGPDVDVSYSIATDLLGNVYVTGNFQSKVDFDPGVATFDLMSNGSIDVFIQKLDTGGNFIWAKSMGGTGNDYGNSISINSSNKIFVSGIYNNTVDFDPNLGTFNLTSNGGSDIFVQKLNPGGYFIWAKSMGAADTDYSNSIASDDSGSVYITGYYKGTADFDPDTGTFNLTSNGSLDIFVVKLRASGSCTATAGTNIITACNSHTWIDGNSYTASNNTATHILINASGCDSVVTLNLTINNVDINVTTTDSSITANAMGATYQWLDCNNNYAVIIGETAKSFIPSGNGVYAVEVTENACTDTSACVTILNVGISDYNIFNEVSIYPNPNEGFVNIDLGNLKGGSIKVFNALGQLYYHKEDVVASSHQFELNVVPGIYIVEVKAQGNKQQFKLVIK